MRMDRLTKRSMVSAYQHPNSFNQLCDTPLRNTSPQLLIPEFVVALGGNIHEETNKQRMNRGDIHQLLLDGADPRVGDKKNNDNTALHNAVRFCRFDICKLLLRGKCR